MIYRLQMCVCVCCTVGLILDVLTLAVRWQFHRLATSVTHAPRASPPSAVRFSSALLSAPNFHLQVFKLPFLDLMLFVWQWKSHEACKNLP